LHVDRQLETVGTGIGSAGPTVIAATEAEQYLELHLTESGQWEAPTALDAAVVVRFGELVASAARPIDDVRGTAAYRTHAVGVMARRTLTWAWNDQMRAAAQKSSCNASD
ncbi:MAG: xanthine dehydrogenase family protein subunit M, partial [Thermoleophilia bacterium]|nr:xanthine dehydrogenase family protein subunit M [Thermoleophilia bacterium]